MKSNTILRGSTLAFSVFLLGQTVLAQESDALDRIHIGALGGIHMNKTQYSNLDERFFPSPNSVISGSGGIFVEFELGSSRMFSIRPELMLGSRNTAIHDIMHAHHEDGTNVRGELDYDITASYLDLRVPLMLNFGSYQSVRPYIFVAPVLSFCSGGEIKVQDAEYQQTLDITEANMNPTYFAGDIGVGVKFPISIGNSRIHLGIEASYEIGFTDTYGDKEKKGWALSENFFVPYDIVGTRKYSGFEVMANVSVPLSAFKKAKRVVKEPIIIHEEPVVVKEEPVVIHEVKKPCYSLEEIIEIMNLGRTIEGLTICAVDLINFEYNKSTLSSDSRDYLNKIAALMLSSDISIEIKGHTDNRGSESYNMELSRKRSKAVYDYLVSKGVEKERLNYSYYGMSRPVADNDTDEGRRMNRRVEFDIK